MYTRKGDDGKTYLLSGKRVYKDSPRVEAYGTLDELNSWLGFAVSISRQDKIKAMLKEVQRAIFVASAELAGNSKKETPKITKEHTARIEQMTNEIYSSLPRLTKFILPGGTMLSSSLHISRTVCRRAERRVVSLKRKERINDEIIPFLNRLSSFLFNLARYANFLEGVEDELWVH